MRQNTEYAWTEYHSRRWEMLVETGWVTMFVERMGDGVQMAKMIWQSPPLARYRML